MRERMKKAGHDDRLEMGMKAPSEYKIAKGPVNDQAWAHEYRAARL